MNKKITWKKEVNANVWQAKDEKGNSFFIAKRQLSRYQKTQSPISYEVYRNGLKVGGFRLLNSAKRAACI